MHVTHVGVPAEAPEDKKQTDEWSVVWPVVYKIPAGKKATHRAEIPLSLEEKNTMARHLSAAWKLANENQARGLECNGAVVVDPEKDVVVAVGKDETTTWGEEKNKRNPLRHTTMVAIGEVAKGILERFPDAGKLPQAKRHCLENAGNTGNGNEEATGPAASTLPLSSAPRCIKEEEPYLCTGYDCYLWREPCTMCAMALVHSRIRRIVYCIPDRKSGALGGSYRLHSLSQLNHHYEVFCWPKKEQEEEEEEMAQ